MNIQDIQEILAHKNLEETKQVYLQDKEVIK